MMKFTVLYTFLLMSFKALGACPELMKKIGNINFQIRPASDGALTECYYMISPFVTKDLIYRNYTFAKDGNMYIFSSYGEGSFSKTTGAREFYFFPRNHELSYSVNETQGRLEIVHVNGDSFSFDLQTAQLIGSSLGRFEVTETPRLGDQGGLEVLNYGGLYLDAGFAMGTSPTINFTKSSKFIDKEGHNCLIQNSLLYIDDSSSTNFGSFKIKDPEFPFFMDKYCPQIKGF